MLRKLFSFLFLVTIIGGAGYYVIFLRNAHLPQGMPQMGALPVSVASAIESEHTEWYTSSGRLEAYSEALIKPRVSGAIEKIHFQEGSDVKKGDTLFTIDTRPFETDIKQAAGQNASAQAALENATAEYNRATKLFEVQAISQKEMDEALRQLNQAKGAAQSASGVLGGAKLNLDYALIKSPISGKIGRIEQKVGNIVNAGPGAPTLTTVVSTSPIYASFNIDETTYLAFVKELNQVKMKDIPVELSLSGQQNFPYKGHVDSFDNQLNTESGTIRVRALLDNKDGSLITGLFANIRLGSPKPRKFILVNEKAINTDQDKKFVLVVNDKNITEFRPVVLGDSIDGLRVIRSGVNAGDHVIVNGLFLMLRPGMPVVPTEVDMKTLTSLTSPASAVQDMTNKH